MNNYLIESSDFVIVKSLINKIIKENKFLDAYTNYYDLEEDPIDNVLEDLNTYSFLSPKKVIILKNVGFLEASSKIKIDDKKIEELIKYIDNPSSDILFIMCVTKLDSRKKIVKDLKKKIKILSEEITPKSIIDEYLKDYKIDFKARNLLLEYTSNNISLLTKECEKLSLFKFDDKTITEEDIKA